MKRITILCAALALLGSALVLWQRHSLLKWRVSQNAADDAPTAAASQTNAAVDQEIAAVREQTRELPRLRNEVGRLHAQRHEQLAAQSENARLLEAKRTGSLIPREPPSGFVGKERLTHAGYDTPEAAVQSFFWALREGNMSAVMQSLSPENDDRNNFELNDAKAREKMETAFKVDEGRVGMNQFNDFIVAWREETAGDAVVLHVQSSIATNTFPLGLKRFGNEWKLTEIGSRGTGRGIVIPHVSPPRTGAPGRRGGRNYNSPPP